MEDAQELVAGEPISMSVRLVRDVDEDDDGDQIADAARYPGRKLVNWWLVVGDAASRALYGIKKVTVKNSLKTKLSFTLPEGSHNLKLYLICDSYVGKSHLVPDDPLRPSNQIFAFSQARIRTLTWKPS